MLSKYKLVKVECWAMQEEVAYALISRNGLGVYREVVVKQAFRRPDLPSLLASIVKVPTSMWVTSPSVPGKVLEVYVEAWTRKGILEGVQEKYPEFLI